MDRAARARLRRLVERNERTNFALPFAHEARLRRRISRLGWRVVRLRRLNWRDGHFQIVERKDDPNIHDYLDDGVEALEAWLKRAGALRRLPPDA